MIRKQSTQSQLLPIDGGPVYTPGVGTHPDLPETLVHFAGRPRGLGDDPPAFADEQQIEGSTDWIGMSADVAKLFERPDGQLLTSTPETRLLKILMTGKLKGAPVFGTSFVCKALQDRIFAGYVEQGFGRVGEGRRL